MSLDIPLGVILDYAEGRISAREAREILEIDEAEFLEVLTEYQFLPRVFDGDDEETFYEVRELPTEFEIATAVFDQIVDDEPVVFTVH
ncbi:hypothetical protein GFM44_23415 [Rhizobium leguminosarum bv. viciae]|nr:hypothetical protein [Rhizobium leguminosarum bv. viciae]